MDIFDLPDVFLRQLLRTVSLKDRLRLRLVCRAFERLIANTNAGHFEKGSIYSRIEDSCAKITICLEDLIINCDDLNDEKQEQLLSFRDNLFRCISFGDFGLKLNAETIPLHFIRRFVKNFKIGELRLHVNTEVQYENALQLMRDFPSSKHCAYCHYLPETEKLLALSPMESLDIVDRREISSDIFFKLIDKHKKIHFYRESVTLDWSDFRKAAKIIANDVRDRKAMFIVSVSTLAGWLRSYGITEELAAGEFCGEFEIVRMAVMYHEGPYEETKLRVGRCNIGIPGYVWTRENRGALVSMANYEV